MSATLTASEEAQLSQTIEMFEVITQSQPQDYQSLEILKEAYLKLGREKDVISTSKRIAQAYVQLGQLSSAILEYETVLQRFPGDPDVQAALKEIETKANNLSVQPTISEAPTLPKSSENTARFKKTSGGKVVPIDVDDGRQLMHKIFVDGKIISAGDFDLCWSTPDLSTPPSGVIEPFIQVLADKGIVLSEKSLRILVEKSRLGYLPLDKYEVDLELMRSFPVETCRRWCVVPFDKMSKTIFVATANPFNRQAAKELSEATKSRLLWYLAPPSELVVNLRKAFR
ncbi:MAG: ral secretory system protein domain protein [Pedosphaera sp.]|nr:ral secretory system protein domain protein [Pedosphaera sp.]